MTKPPRVPTFGEIILQAGDASQVCGVSRLHKVGVDVGGAQVDVHADGLGPLVEDAVAGRDETEGRGDDLVAIADAEGADEEVEAGGANSEVVNHLSCKALTFEPPTLEAQVDPNPRTIQSA